MRISVRSQAICAGTGSAASRQAGSSARGRNGSRSRYSRASRTALSGTTGSPRSRGRIAASSRSSATVRRAATRCSRRTRPRCRTHGSGWRTRRRSASAAPPVSSTCSANHPRSAPRSAVAKASSRCVIAGIVPRRAGAHRHPGRMPRPRPRLARSAPSPRALLRHRALVRAYLAAWICATSWRGGGRRWPSRSRAGSGRFAGCSAGHLLETRVLSAGHHSQLSRAFPAVLARHEPRSAAAVR